MKEEERDRVRQLGMKSVSGGRSAGVLVALLLAPFLILSATVLIALLLVVGAGVAAWLWWRTRAMRRAMKSMPMATRPEPPAFDVDETQAASGTVIEGESRRVSDEDRRG